MSFLSSSSISIKHLHSNHYFRFPKRWFFLNHIVPYLLLLSFSLSHLCLNQHIVGMDANPFHPQCLLAKEHTDGGDWYIDGEDGDDDTIVHIVAVLVASSHCRRKYFLWNFQCWHKLLTGGSTSWCWWGWWFGDDWPIFLQTECVTCKMAAKGVGELVGRGTRMDKQADYISKGGALCTILLANHHRLSDGLHKRCFYFSLQGLSPGTGK